MGTPRTLAVFQVLADHPGGLTTPEITALVDPAPDKPRLARYLCYATLRRYEGQGQGLVCRAGQRATRGAAVIWRLEAAPEPPPRPAGLRGELRAAERAIALTSRRITVSRRKVRALKKIEEGIGELERADREIAAFEGSFGCAAKLPGRGGARALGLASPRDRGRWCCSSAAVRHPAGRRRLGRVRRVMSEPGRGLPGLLTGEVRAGRWGPGGVLVTGGF